METTNHVDFPLSMAAIAQTLIKHPDPHMVAFFKRCATEEAERDPRGEERRDRSLLRFGRILRTLTPFTADDVLAAVDSLRGSCADGMSMDEADAVERSAAEFAVHHHAACVAARAAGFEADAPCIESCCREIDMMQDFLLDGRTALTLHVYMDLPASDVIVSVEHADTGVFDQPDDEQHYTSIFDATRAAAGA